MLFVSLSACDVIISNISDLPEEVPEGENPNDPDSPAFEMTEIYLTDVTGPNFIALENSFQLNWAPVDDLSGLVYRYKIAEPGQSLDEIAYSDYSTETFFFIDNLKETFADEVYSYAIEVSLISAPDKNYVLTGFFQVDAVQDRSFLFRPQVISPNNDGSFTAQIYIDEILAEDDLRALSLVVNYNSNELNVTEVQVYEDERSFLYRENGQIIAFSEVNNSTIEIEAGVAGTNLNPVEGGGAICEITFVPQFSFGNASISISTSSLLKRSDGSDFDILDFDEAILVQN